LADPVEGMASANQDRASSSPQAIEETLTVSRLNYCRRSPDLAQQVNNELLLLFIDENLRSQQQLSESTTAFSTAARGGTGQTGKAEAKVRAFKATHFSDLPSQMQRVTFKSCRASRPVANHPRDIDSARQHKLYLGSLLNVTSHREWGQGRET